MNNKAQEIHNLIEILRLCQGKPLCLTVTLCDNVSEPFRSILRTFGTCECVNPSNRPRTAHQNVGPIIHSSEGALDLTTRPNAESSSNAKEGGKGKGNGKSTVKGNGVSSCSCSSVTVQLQSQESQTEVLALLTNDKEVQTDIVMREMTDKSGETEIIARVAGDKDVQTDISDRHKEVQTDPLPSYRAVPTAGDVSLALPVAVIPRAPAALPAVQSQGQESNVSVSPHSYGYGSTLNVSEVKRVKPDGSIGNVNQVRILDGGEGVTILPMPPAKKPLTITQVTRTKDKDGNSSTRLVFSTKSLTSLRPLKSKPPSDGASTSTGQASMGSNSSSKIDWVGMDWYENSRLGMNKENEGQTDASVTLPQESRGEKRKASETDQSIPPVAVSSSDELSQNDEPSTSTAVPSEAVHKGKKKVVGQKDGQAVGQTVEGKGKQAKSRVTSPKKGKSEKPFKHGVRSKKYQVENIMKKLQQIQAPSISPVKSETAAEENQDNDFSIIWMRDVEREIFASTELASLKAECDSGENRESEMEIKREELEEEKEEDLRSSDAANLNVSELQFEDSDERSAASRRREKTRDCRVVIERYCATRSQSTRKLRKDPIKKKPRTM